MIHSHHDHDYPSREDILMIQLRVSRSTTRIYGDRAQADP